MIITNMVTLLDHEYIFRNVAMAKRSLYTFMTRKINIVNKHVSINQMDCILNKSSLLWKTYLLPSSRFDKIFQVENAYDIFKNGQIKML